MPGTLGRLLTVAAVLLLTAGVSIAGASSKFTYTQAIDDAGSLTVGFQEGSMKRFSSVDYRLDATADAVWSCGGGQSIGKLYQPSSNVTSTPDAKGGVDATLTLDISQSGASGSGCTCGCGSLQHVDYMELTLTNLATGHVYRLDSISRDFAP